MAALAAGPQPAAASLQQSIESLSLQLSSIRAAQGPQLVSPGALSHSVASGGGGGGGGSGSGGGSDGALASGRPKSNSQGALKTGANKLASALTKKASRAKELLLQNLGKAERTRDDAFARYELNFHKQQLYAAKLHKEFKLYAGALRGAREAARSLHQCVQQSTDDYQPARHDLVCESLAQFQHLAEDRLAKLRAQVLANMAEYLADFGELRDKLAKRKRKLIDYDSARRVYELVLGQSQRRRELERRAPAAGPLNTFRSALASMGAAGPQQARNSSSLPPASQQQQAAAQGSQLASQLVDEARLLKLREQFNYAKVMYDTINAELRDELALVYEKKMRHLLATLQAYFALEAHFHLHASKLFASAGEVVDELPEPQLLRQLLLAGQQAGEPASDTDDHDRDLDLDRPDHPRLLAAARPHAGSRKLGPDCHQDTQLPRGSEAASSGVGSSGASSGSGSPSSGASQSPRNSHMASPGSCQLAASEPQVEQERFGEQLVAESEVAAGVSGVSVVGSGVASGPPTPPTPPPPPPPLNVTINVPAAGASQPTGEAGQSAPANAQCLYKVKTNYKYMAEDVDELCFEPGETIQVLALEPGQEPEDGWLVGVRESNGQRGLFPANFTEPL